MRIRYTSRAELSVERIDNRWRSNRPAAPDLFWTELGEALELLQVSPQRGTVYKTRKGTEVRRVLLPKTEYHLYYALSQDAEEVMLLVVWGARRDRGPKL